MCSTSEARTFTPRAKAISSGSTCAAGSPVFGGFQLKMIPEVITISGFFRGLDRSPIDAQPFLVYDIS